MFKLKLKQFCVSSEIRNSLQSLFVFILFFPTALSTSSHSMNTWVLAFTQTHSVLTQLPYAHPVVGFSVSQQQVNDGKTEDAATKRKRQRLRSRHRSSEREFQCEAILSKCAFARKRKQKHERYAAVTMSVRHFLC